MSVQMLGTRVSCWVSNRLVTFGFNLALIKSAVTLRNTLVRIIFHNFGVIHPLKVDV